MSSVDSREFRRVLGHFATGVTVVTTLDENGAPVGITVNSFNSVSLEPPMVLWSIARKSGKRAAFENSEYFVVNILGADQVALSQRFARGGDTQFTDIQWRPGIGGTPLLPACAARFQCRKVYQYDGGDHIIIVGRVDRFDETTSEALVFHRGKYGVVETHPGDDQTPPGGYEDDFLMALLMRAAYEFVQPFKRRIAELDLSEAEVRVLTFLNEHDARDIPRLAYGTMLPEDQVAAAVESLLAQSLITRDPPSSPLVAITDEGRRRVLPVLAIAKAHEARVLAQYTPEQVFRLKRELRELADLSRS